MFTRGHRAHRKRVQCTLQHSWTAGILNLAKLLKLAKSTWNHNPTIMFPVFQEHERACMCYKCNYHA